VTTASMILPVFYLLRFVTDAKLFSLLFHCVLVVMAFLFVLDFSVKKINWLKLFTGKRT
jgi:hypothetical protein